MFRHVPVDVLSCFHTICMKTDLSTPLFVWPEAIFGLSILHLQTHEYRVEEGELSQCLLPWILSNGLNGQAPWYQQVGNRATALKHLWSTQHSLRFTVLYKNKKSQKTEFYISRGTLGNHQRWVILGFHNIFAGNIKLKQHYEYHDDLCTFILPLSFQKCILLHKSYAMNCYLGTDNLSLWHNLQRNGLIMSLDFNFKSQNELGNSNSPFK